MKNSSLLTGLLSCSLLLSNFVFSQEPVQVDKELASKFSSLINREQVSEAYPWLSGDGLRLYFTTDREGGFGRLYFCSRNSVKENFNAPRPLSENLPDGYYAATLTADELSIYSSHEDEIYVAKRNSINDDFGEPVMIKGLMEGHKYAPAISPDGNELIVIFDNEEEKDIAIHYRKNSSGTFIEVNRMVADQTVDLDPGQFSKDGLSFYASYETDKIGEPDFKTEESERLFTQKIIRFTRQSLNDVFKEIEEMPGLSSPLRNHQPTMNEDETIFIVTTSAKDLWSENDLKLINLEEIYIVEDCEVEDFVADTMLRDVLISCLVKSCGVKFFPSEQLELDSDTIVYNSCFKRYDLKILPQIDTLTFICVSVCDWSEGAVLSITEALPEKNILVKVYPNPFTDNILINLDKTNLNYNFDLYDISGRKVLSTKLNNVSNYVRFNQPGSGVYIYKMTDKTGRLITSGKLVKK